MKPTSWTILLPTFLCGLVLAGPQREGYATSEFSEGFDQGEPSWSVRFDARQVRLLAHRRTDQQFIRGGGSEQLVFEAAAPDSRVRLEHRLPPARAIDDLKLSLSVRSSRKGAELLLRVVFPHQQDPATGDVLRVHLRGGTYTEAGAWQRLECGTLEKQIHEQIILARARLNHPNLDTRDLYVDQAVVTARLEPGRTELFIDDLQFGPIVSPRPETPLPPVVEEPAGPPVEFRLHRLLVSGQPFFPRLVAHHAEPLAVLKDAGVNVVWVPDFQDEAVLAELQQHGLWATATPPRAVSPTGELLDARSAGMLPFSPQTAPILFWNLGTRIPMEARSELIGWAQQVRAADHRLPQPRPLMVDVMGMERVISRQVPMLGVSRHMLNTSFSLQQYRDWLIQRRLLAKPGSFVWTWLQTEPTSAWAERRESARRSPIVIEPEQVRLQTYAALAAGCRGLGYWKTTPLDDDSPGAVERRLAITQLNLELELIEPWLATGTGESKQIPFEVQLPRPAAVGQRGLDFRVTEQEHREGDALLRTRENQLKRDEQLAGELEAAVLQTDRGRLLLPVWYEHDAQYVPGQLAANDATMIVEGVPQTASAYEITTTDIRSLPREPVAGGLKITLRRFDQTAMILVTSDPAAITSLKARVALIAEKSGRTAIDLARAKLVRVSQVDEELRKLGVGQPDAPQILGRAASLIEQAETSFQRRDYHAARERSGECLQLLRMLQRACWDDAVRNLSSPLSSPHTVCFQTLPDHWRMVGRLGRSPIGEENLLRSGDFEDIDTMVVEGWRHAQGRIDGVRAAAELYPTPRSGSYALRLVAVPEPGADPPTVVPRTPVTVTTPEVTVRSGQVVYIDGWMRATTPVVGSLDGAMIYDSLAGPAGALRWHQRSDWQRFQMIREVQESGTLSVTIALTGLGEIQLDDLRIIPHTPVPQATPPGDSAADPDPHRSRLLDLWNRVPRLNPLSPRR